MMATRHNPLSARTVPRWGSVDRRGVSGLISSCVSGIYQTALILYIIKHIERVNTPAGALADYGLLWHWRRWGKAEMTDQEKTKAQLIAELATHRARVACLEEAATLRAGEMANLGEIQARYRLIVSLISDYVYYTRWDSEHDLQPMWIEGAFESITGFTPGESEVQGGWRALLHPDDYGQDELDMAELRANRKVVTEVRIIRKDGKIRWVRSYAHPIWDEKRNQLGGIYGAVQDITEQKRAEEARREAEILRIELEKERELRELKSRFVSMVVHDFRNPITTIQLALSTIKKYRDHLEPERVDEKIDHALQRSRQLNALIDDVLTIGKIEFVAGDFDPHEIELAAFCRTVFDEFAQSIDSNRHHLVFVGDAQPVLMAVDKDLLTRAIVNLLSNAVKYSPLGGTIQLKVSAPTDSAVIEISDHGIGIPAEDRGRLFSGFLRASNVGSIEGTGLGLTIVKQIVDMHGGRIDCDSEVNEGTSFTITLPLLAYSS